MDFRDFFLEGYRSKTDYIQVIKRLYNIKMKFSKSREE